MYVTLFWKWFIMVLYWVEKDFELGAHTTGPWELLCVQVL